MEERKDLEGEYIQGETSTEVLSLQNIKSLGLVQFVFWLQELREGLREVLGV